MQALEECIRISSQHAPAVDLQTTSGDENIPDDGPQDRIQGGRISDQNNTLLEEGFRKLDDILAGIADETGLPCKQIITLWEKRSNPTASNFHPWRAYESYFKVNQEEELHRIEDGSITGMFIPEDYNRRSFVCRLGT